ncbi:MerR family transcriptional regulator [Kitasatospora griseola]|uniref:MerR family transcriptional regulator n=1 Tax=Kitasatospora griseola TaxID=2064 RepID=UPI0036DF1034
MKSSSETLPVADVAARFGLATRALRHREAMGLLEPDRDAAGHRRYGTAYLVRVAAVLTAKAAGRALDDIRDL